MIVDNKPIIRIINSETEEVLAEFELNEITLDTYSSKESSGWINDLDEDNQEEEL